MKWKWFTISTLALILTLGVGVGLLHSGAVQKVTQQANGITLPLVNVEVGADSATSLWAVNHTTQEKWVLDGQGLRSESLVRQKAHNCYSRSTGTLQD